MAYQIKSTPFFRRILSTSKKNGQLQKLKEEYERMKEFNDRAIEMKMRQVRLKRLFKEIEDIKESSTQFPKKRRLTGKTNDEVRFETLMKAKELGKEYSKMNALLTSGNVSRLDQFACGAKLEDNKKHLMAKAVSYGNEYSKANFEKAAQAAPRKKISNRCLLKSVVIENQERLKQRNSYGNFRSSINMSKILNRRQQKSPNANSVAKSVKPSTTRVKIVSCQSEDEEVLRRYGLFSGTDTSRDNASKSFDARGLDNDDSIAHMRALQHWHKLALTVRNCFDRRQRRKQLPLDQSNDEELSLPSSENGLDGVPHADENDDINPDHDNDNYNDNESAESSAPTPLMEPLEDSTSNEVLLRVEPLCDRPWPEVFDYMAPPSIKTSNRSLDIVASDSKVGRSVIITSDNVQRLAKMFEPIVREAAQKEACEGVRKLKSIFEHQ